MKNFIFAIGICAIILSIGMSACRSKGTKQSEMSNETVTTIKDLVEKKWNLVELNGVDISTDHPNIAANAFIMFHAHGDERMVNGNSGCNNFSGTYSLGSGSELKFSGVASTRMMCIDMTIEDQVNQLFQIVDNYTIQNGRLSLLQGETPLARFLLESE